MIRIVLLEDHAIVREGVRFMLDQVPEFSVVAEFECPQQLFDAIAGLDADILITDLDFERFRGVEILQHPAAITTHFRTIVLSMHGEAHLVKRAMDLGVFGYVTKSRGARELVAAIHEVHKGHFYLTDDIRNQVAVSPPHITKREREVLLLLIGGETAKAIGTRLGISDKTVYIHRASLMEKFGAKTIIELGRKARDAGI
ncbi:response regulator transcription factor [Arenimonas sp. GDDSR-1]|uniref:response regulator transcription factor n=1 Tax=Arenimonas sp. GDDSR-1 TaxID=2950125 RepID=UPI002616F331|nr:response regulator transcription factor [Arenimonas sp. GDDSR-1]